MRRFPAVDLSIPAAFLAALLLLTPVAASAQEIQSEGSDPRSMTQEILEIEHADVRALARVLNVFPIDVSAHPELGMITLHGNREDVAAAAAAARRLDLPPKPSATVEVTAHVLGGSRDRDLGGGVPAPLEEVAGQLREVFGYQGVRLLDSLLIRVRDQGDGLVRGVISPGPDEPDLPYLFGFNKISLVNGDDARQVRVDGLVFEVRVGPPDPPAPSEGQNPPRARGDVVHLQTDIDVREGQKAVVGKAASGHGDREALIVVIEVRVTE